MSQNPQEHEFHTAAAGSLVGYSTQQVRDLERLGVIPPAERAENGYRLYRQHHIVALRAYRALAAAVGPVSARQLLPALITDSIDDAAEKIDELHAAIARGRANLRAALRGLDTILSERVEVFDEYDTMTISELAGALDIRTSALRHWEREGLVSPDRLVGSRVRSYGARAIAEARIVAALRGGGYGIPAIARILDQLRADGLTQEARALLDDRLAELSRRSIALLDAAAHLHTLLLGRVTTEVSAILR